LEQLVLKVLEGKMVLLEEMVLEARKAHKEKEVRQEKMV
jgi:hypothetical protein